jgi:hypothetical protein
VGGGGGHVDLKIGWSCGCLEAGRGR